MSNKFEEPWTHNEQSQLLLNIIQAQNRDVVGFLLHHIRERGIVPQWPEIALPAGKIPLRDVSPRNADTDTGRSLHASQAMFQTMTDQHQQRAHQSFTFAPSSASPYPHPASYQQTRNFTEPIPQLAAPIPRAIQPRPARSTDSPAPASTNGEPSLTIVRTVGSTEYGSSERRKKRGRPTKEEAEERDRLLAAEGKVYEPKKRPSKKFRTSTGTLVPGEEEATAAATGPAFSDIVAQTPVEQRIEPKEETSSSGKRRTLRARQESNQTTSQSAAGASAIITTPQQATFPKQDSDRPAESPTDRFMARFGERGGGGDSSGSAPPTTTTSAQSSFSTFRVEQALPTTTTAGN